MLPASYACLDYSSPVLACSSTCGVYLDPGSTSSSQAALYSISRTLLSTPPTSPSKSTSSTPELIPASVGHSAAFQCSSPKTCQTFNAPRFRQCSV